MPKNKPTRTLSATLRHHHEANGLKVVTIAGAFVCSDETAYTMLEGGRDKWVDTLNHALCRLPDAAADDLASVLFCGTPYEARRRPDLDGREDGIEAALRVAQHSVDLIDELYASLSDRILTSDESAGMTNKINVMHERLSALETWIARNTARPAETSFTHAG